MTALLMSYIKSLLTEAVKVNPNANGNENQDNSIFT